MPHPAVDWSEAPKRARWWAMDSDGHAHWFLAPNVSPFANFLFSRRPPAFSSGPV